MEELKLVIDEEYMPKIFADEGQALKLIQKKFMKSYLDHRNTISVKDWLRMEMSRSLPGRDIREIAQMSEEIVSTLEMQEEKKLSLQKALDSGRNKESWFAGQIREVTSCMNVRQSSEYLQGLDEALADANESLYHTIHTQTGINQNPNLDGFIAEQYHAQTFNLNAEATGSQYRAKVLEPGDGRYALNSVDIVIVDKAGKVVRRYQSKYCKDATATAHAFERGDYRGQQKLVPEEQGQAIAQKTTTVISAPDGTTSNPLSKTKAKQLQREAQNGKWNQLNWNEYQVKDLAIGIGKQAGQAALMGAVVGIGFETAQKVWHGEKIEGEDLIKTAITTGSDFGVKAAVAGALKVGVEKGIITAIPKGTPASTIANITYVAVENVKVIGKIASKELTVKEGMEKLEQTTVSTVAGIAASVKGAAIGSAIGSVFGPVGTIVGSFIGGTVGYMAGSKIGESVVKGVQKIREKTKSVICSVGRTALETANSISIGIGSFCTQIMGLFA